MWNISNVRFCQELCSRGFETTRAIGDRLVRNHEARFPNSTRFRTTTRRLAQLCSDGRKLKNCPETGFWEVSILNESVIPDEFSAIWKLTLHAKHRSRRTFVCTPRPTSCSKSCALEILQRTQAFTCATGAAGTSGSTPRQPTDLPCTAPITERNSTKYIIWR